MTGEPGGQEERKNDLMMVVRKKLDNLSLGKNFFMQKKMSLHG